MTLHEAANPQGLEARYGPQYEGDSVFTRKCRLLQSWYRVERLKQSSCGCHVPEGKRVGSALENGETSGANFLSLAARACAWEKLAEKQLVNPDLTVDRYRLFNNMLSSQPMCFNLFADLRLGVHHDNANAREIIAAMFPESPIRKVDRVEIEMLPQPKEDYIDDRTAFDAVVLFTGSDGRPGLASIETKYTDKLGVSPARSVARQKQIARDIGLFDDRAADLYDSVPFGQIIRNLLLTLVYGKRHECSSVRNYVIAPAEDEETRQVIHSLRERLAPKYRDAIAFISLEDVGERGLRVARGEYKRHLRAFHQRYLDFGQIETFLSEK